MPAAGRITVNTAVAGGGGGGGAKESHPKRLYILFPYCYATSPPPSPPHLHQGICVLYFVSESTL
jgi:hypothetical protein